MHQNQTPILLGVSKDKVRRKFSGAKDGAEGGQIWIAALNGGVRGRDKG